MKRLSDMTEPEIKQYLNMLASATESVMPAADNERGRACFVVVVFDDPGIMRMVSNAPLDQARRAMREALEDPL